MSTLSLVLFTVLGADADARLIHTGPDVTPVFSFAIGVSSRYDEEFRQRELGVTGEQERQLWEIYRSYKKEFGELNPGTSPFEEITDDEKERRTRASHELVMQADRSLRKVLKPEQARRIRELHLQEILFGRGNNLLTLKLRGEDFGIELTDEQRFSLGELLVPYRKKVDLEKTRRMAKLTGDAMLEILSPGQLAQVQSSVGKRPQHIEKLAVAHEAMFGGHPVVNQREVGISVNSSAVVLALQLLLTPEGIRELSIDPEQKREIEDIKSRYDEISKEYLRSLILSGPPVQVKPGDLIPEILALFQELLKKDQFNRLRQLVALSVLNRRGLGAFLGKNNTNMFRITFSDEEVVALRKGARENIGLQNDGLIPFVARECRVLLDQVLTKEQMRELRQLVGKQTQDDELLKIGYKTFFDR